MRHSRRAAVSNYRQEATSLIRLEGGRLLFTWSDRHTPSMRIAVSGDAGRTWSDPAGWSVRDGEHLKGADTLLQVWGRDGSVFGGTYSDTGEPCTLQLADGRVIAVYYWADGDDPMRYIEAANLQSLKAGTSLPPCRTRSCQKDAESDAATALR